MWKVIKIELLISRHKQQCWAGATYNFRNKSDALIKALAILPDPTSRIQFKALICLFEENVQIFKYWQKSFQCQILLAWHSIWERANFPADEIKTSNDLLQHRKLWTFTFRIGFDEDDIENWNLRVLRSTNISVIMVRPGRSVVFAGPSPQSKNDHWA